MHGGSSTGTLTPIFATRFFSFEAASSIVSMRAPSPVWSLCPVNVEKENFLFAGIIFEHRERGFLVLRSREFEA